VGGWPWFSRQLSDSVSKPVCNTTLLLPCRFEHSRVSAIMGPSGAGKTTFLNCLMGRVGGAGRQCGRVLVNGREMRLSALQSIAGFVPQDVSGGCVCMDQPPCRSLGSCASAAFQ
jgi:ABC-type multidrug transport system ATPase subunit